MGSVSFRGTATLDEDYWHIEDNFLDYFPLTVEGYGNNDIADEVIKRLSGRDHQGELRHMPEVTSEFSALIVRTQKIEAIEEVEIVLSQMLADGFGQPLTQRIFNGMVIDRDTITLMHDNEPIGAIDLRLARKLLPPLAEFVANENMGG
jgi:hypothetical protein